MVAVVVCTMISFNMCVLHYASSTHDLEPPSGTWFETQYLRLEEREPVREGLLLLEGYSNPRLTLRMWCTVESAVRAHPHLPVSLLMTASVIKENALLHNMTSQFSNLHVLHLNLSQLFHGSLLEAWYIQNKWKDSYWPQSHLNDGIRWMLLWKYGGIYLDLDTIVVRSLAHLPNCTARESDNYVAAGALKFSQGHPVIGACLHHLAHYFSGTAWGANGPELLTQVLIDRCGLELPSDRVPGCPDVTVLPPRAFYPLPWWEWRRYMQEDPALAYDLLNDAQVYSLHMWSLHSRHKPVLLTSNQIYARAAHALCPTTVAHAGLTM